MLPYKIGFALNPVIKVFENVPTTPNINIYKGKKKRSSIVIGMQKREGEINRVIIIKLEIFNFFIKIRETRKRERRQLLNRDRIIFDLFDLKI